MQWAACSMSEASFSLSPGHSACALGTHLPGCSCGDCGDRGCEGAVTVSFPALPPCAAAEQPAWNCTDPGSPFHRCCGMSTSMGWLGQNSVFHSYHLSTIFKYFRSWMSDDRDKRVFLTSWTREGILVEVTGELSLNSLPSIAEGQPGTEASCGNSEPSDKVQEHKGSS